MDLNKSRAYKGRWTYSCYTGFFLYQSLLINISKPQATFSYNYRQKNGERKVMKETSGARD